MATKSFLKDIVITDRKDAKSFVEALENAEEKASQKKQVMKENKFLINLG